MKPVANIEEERGMSERYVKHLWGANTDIVSNPVHGSEVDISSSHSGTLKFTKIVCSGHAKISVDHSATLVIDELECESLTIEVSYASTLRIGTLRCAGKVAVNVVYSSLFVVDDGAVDATAGVVNYSSTGKFFATIGTDGVVAQNASTWVT